MIRFKYLPVLIASLFILLICASPAWAQEIEEQPQTVVKQDVTILEDGQSTLIIEEERLARVRHVIAYLLQNARNHAQTGETGLAADELDMAAAYMYIDVQSAPEDVRKNVEQVTEHLESIASASDSSKTTVNVFDSAIYSAHHTLADYYRQRAATFVAADFSRNAGYALDAALTHYKQAAMSWARVSETPVNEVLDRDLMQGLEEFSAAMKTGHPYNKADASGLIDQLNMSITGLTSQS